MPDYFFDEERALAYKINPLSVTIMESEKEGKKAILVHTNVKVTNFKKEKIRRILSEKYPVDQFDKESAKQKFAETILSNFIEGASKISETEYQEIKARIERQ